MAGAPRFTAGAPAVSVPCRRAALSGRFSDNTVTFRPSPHFHIEILAGRTSQEFANDSHSQTQSNLRIKRNSIALIDNLLLALVVWVGQKAGNILLVESKIFKGGHDGLEA